MNKIISKTRDAFLELYLIDKKAPIILICPGGGYNHRSDRESWPIAREFNQAGFHAAVVGYNVEGDELLDGPLLDLSWAVCEVRSNAVEWLIEEDKVVVCGFSAGGHLAASLGVLWNDESRFKEKALRELHKPNGMILNYPVIVAGEYAHQGSFTRLTKDTEKQNEYSLEQYVSKDTPKCFIWHTVDDEVVPIQNTLIFVEELVKNKVSVEVLLFPEGCHGLSLATEEVANDPNKKMVDPHVARWLNQCIDWVRSFI